MEPRLINILLTNLVGITVCMSIRYDCDQRNVSCGCSYSDAIFQPTSVPGDEDVVDGSWSMIVSLRLYQSEEHFCAGTLLSSSFILTAAYCVDHFSTTSSINITVDAGITSRSDSTAYHREVQEIHIHPNYTGSPLFLNNIAVLQIDRPLHVQKNPVLASTCVHRINSSLPIDEQHPTNGTPLVVIGWGAMRPRNFPLSDSLKQIQVYAMHNEDQICNESIRNGEFQFCAGLYDDDEDACLGDSGGPVFYWTGHYWEQVGVIGYNFHCGHAGHPGIYTRLSYYWQWIETILNIKREYLEPQDPPPFPTTTTSRRPTITRTTSTRRTTSISTLFSEPVTEAFTMQPLPSTTSNLQTSTITNTGESLTTTTTSAGAPLRTTANPGIPQTMTTTVTLPSPQATTTTTVPLSRLTYECDRSSDECGCSLTNVALSSHYQQVASINTDTEDAYPYSWSMIVSIRMNGTKHQCVGTILSDSFILTAAHCVLTQSNNGEMTVAAGLHSLSQYATSVRVIDQVHIHENYSIQRPHLHDIAILHLDQPLALKTQPVFSKTCLSNIESVDSMRTSLLISVGWRHQNIAANEQNTLQQASLKPITNPNVACFNSIYNQTYHQFCAGLLMNNSCKESFGEPVFIHRTNYWEQVGILSQASDCASMNHSGIYTRLSSYTNWMQRVMKNTKIPMRQPLRRNGGSKLRQNIFILYTLVLCMKLLSSSSSSTL